MADAYTSSAAAAVDAAAAAALADSPAPLPPPKYTPHYWLQASAGPFRSVPCYLPAPVLAYFLALPRTTAPGVLPPMARHANHPCTTTTAPLTQCSHTFLQLRALSSRLLRNTYRHPFSVALNFAATLAAALCLGLIFHHTGECVVPYCLCSGPLCYEDLPK